MLLNFLLIANTNAKAEVYAFCEWCDENEVQINMDKSCFLHSSACNNTSYHCGKMPILIATSFKDLGVVRSADGTYALHDDYVVSKAQSICSAITKNLHYLLTQ